MRKFLCLLFTLSFLARTTSFGQIRDLIEDDFKIQNTLPFYNDSLIKAKGYKEAYVYTVYYNYKMSKLKLGFEDLPSGIDTSLHSIIYFNDFGLPQKQIDYIISADTIDFFYNNKNQLIKRVEKNSHNGILVDSITYNDNTKTVYFFSKIFGNSIKKTYYDTLSRIKFIEFYDENEFKKIKLRQKNEYLYKGDKCFEKSYSYDNGKKKQMNDKNEFQKIGNLYYCLKEEFNFEKNVFLKKEIKNLTLSNNMYPTIRVLTLHSKGEKYTDKYEEDVFSYTFKYFFNENLCIGYYTFESLDYPKCLSFNYIEYK